jgi:hypothetical protein
VSIGYTNAIRIPASHKGRRFPRCLTAGCDCGYRKLLVARTEEQVQSVVGIDPEWTSRWFPDVYEVQDFALAVNDPNWLFAQMTDQVLSGAGTSL